MVWCRFRYADTTSLSRHDFVKPTRRSMPRMAVAARTRPWRILSFVHTGRFTVCSGPLPLPLARVAYADSCGCRPARGRDRIGARRGLGFREAVPLVQDAGSALRQAQPYFRTSSQPWHLRESRGIRLTEYFQGPEWFLDQVDNSGPLIRPFRLRIGPVRILFDSVRLVADFPAEPVAHRMFHVKHDVALLLTLGPRHYLC